MKHPPSFSAAAPTPSEGPAPASGQKMQHPPPSFSAAAPTPSEGPAPDTNTNKSFSKKIKIKNTNKRSIKVTELEPYRFRTEEEMKAFDHLITPFDDEELPDRMDDNGRHRFVELGFDENVFDAEHLPDPLHGGQPAPIRDFKKDPSLFRRLTKCATLAIGDYNSHTRKDYRFVDIKMAVWQPVAGALYHITFQARNAENDCRTFEATVFTDRCMREVQRIRMKGSRTWYNGTLRELLD